MVINEIDHFSGIVSRIADRASSASLVLDCLPAFAHSYPGIAAMKCA